MHQIAPFMKEGPSNICWEAFWLVTCCRFNKKTNKFSGKTSLMCWNHLLELFSICAVNIVFIRPLLKRYWLQQHAIVVHEKHKQQSILGDVKDIAPMWAKRLLPSSFSRFVKRCLAADVSRNQCMKFVALHHPKNPTKVGFHPCNETKTCFFSSSKFFHSSPPSHVWVPFCSRFCVDALRTKRGWWSSPWWSFLDHFMKNSAVAVDQLRPQATPTLETPETVLKETAASRQRAFTPPRHWEVKRLLISELLRLKMFHWFVNQISEDFVVWSGLRRDASSALD